MDSREIQKYADDLLRALEAWARLMPYSWCITAGRRQTAYRTEILFTPKQFCRLAGMQHIHDQYPDYLNSPEDTFRLLTASSGLRTRLVQAQKWHLNYSRIESLACMEDSLLHFRQFFLFDRMAAIREHTNIRADFILKHDVSPENGARHYIFLTKQDGSAAVPSAQFIRRAENGEADFTRTHTPCKLLQVTRTELASGKTEELFRNSNYRA